MSKDSAAKCCQNNKEKLKKTCERYQTFYKEEKEKSNNKFCICCSSYLHYL